MRQVLFCRRNHNGSRPFSRKLSMMLPMKLKQPRTEPDTTTVVVVGGRPPGTVMPGFPRIPGAMVPGFVRAAIPGIVISGFVRISTPGFTTLGIGVTPVIRKREG
jgi:hypothetical protein